MHFHSSEEFTEVVDVVDGSNATATVEPVATDENFDAIFDPTDLGPGGEVLFQKPHGAPDSFANLAIADANLVTAVTFWRTVLCVYDGVEQNLFSRLVFLAHSIIGHF